MSELRYLVMVRREGEHIHSSDKFITEEFHDIEELKDAVSHFIQVEYEAELDRVRSGEL